MGYNIGFSHQPLFHRLFEVARPQKNDSPFSSDSSHLLIESGAEKWICVT